VTRPRVHLGGTSTHFEQHLALRRAGWRIVDAVHSRWLTDPAGAAEMLSKELLRSKTWDARPG
jgi:hypothetical protein